jgi:broad specificity phosphatase PhoE
MCLKHCLLIVRHGATEWNDKNLVSTHTDIPLSARGTAQAQALSEQLAGARFDHAWSSPLVRVKDTLTTALGVESQLTIVEDERLAEPSAGPFEGHHFDNLDNDRDPLSPAWHAYNDKATPVVPDGAVAPSDAAVGAHTFLEMAARTPGRHIAASHGALIHIMAAAWLQMPVPQYTLFKLDNCAAALWKFWDEPPHQLVGWNLY